MSEIITIGIEQFSAQSLPELLAVVLAIAYLVLATRQNIWCWPCAFCSTAIFTWVFFDVSLLMESLLNVYYMVMAVYGYWCWTRGKGADRGLAIGMWTWHTHLVAILLIGALTLISGWLLHNHTAAVRPFLDSFTTWGSVVTTFMVARKIFEHWFYWLVIDSISLFLYWDRELYATALLMMVYLVLVLAGIAAWLRQLKTQQYYISEEVSA